MKNIVDFNTNGTRLNEVDAMRPVLVVLLVLYHSFCMYDNKWELCENASSLDLYKWISRFANAFLLQGYFFLSGYVWAFQRETFRKKESIIKLLQNKTLRLLFPSISFGFIYYLLFYKGYPISSVDDTLQIFESIMYILNGPGHLWFLLALFWCFVFTYFLNKMDCSPALKLRITLICAIFPYIALPLRLGWSMFYILFFYLGYYTFLNKDGFLKLSNKARIIWGGYLLFIGVFVLLCSVKDTMLSIICNKYLLRSVSQMIEIIYSILGLMSFFLIIVRIVNRYTVPLKTITWLGSYSFSIYIFQEFILRLIYYKTEIPMCLPSTLIPWFGFSLTLFFSVLLSITIKKI